MGFGHTQIHVRQADAEVRKQKDALAYAGTESTPYIPRLCSSLHSSLCISAAPVGTVFSPWCKVIDRHTRTHTQAGHGFQQCSLSEMNALLPPPCLTFQG